MLEAVVALVAAQAPAGRTDVATEVCRGDERRTRPDGFRVLDVQAVPEPRRAQKVKVAGRAYEVHGDAGNVAGDAPQQARVGLLSVLRQLTAGSPPGFTTSGPEPLRRQRSEAGYQSTGSASRQATAPLTDEK